MLQSREKVPKHLSLLSYLRCAIVCTGAAVVVTVRVVGANRVAEDRLLNSQVCVILCLLIRNNISAFQIRTT
jgi:hypothetical protein